MRKLSLPFLLLGCYYAIANISVAQTGENKNAAGWTDTFALEQHDLSAEGRNAYFILQPGYELVLSGVEHKDTTVLTIRVLEETAVIDGVTTRVIEEREEVNKQVVEISRNFFAISRQNKGVFYFGEDVDIYENGKIAGHEGSWRAGQNNAKPGLMLPGLALLGSRYYQEIAPGVAMDRAEIVNLNKTLETPAGTFNQCLLTEETSLLEPDAREYKIYAPGIGLIKDGDLLLIKYGFAEK